MIQDRLVLKPQLIDFSASVLHHTVALILLTHSCGGQTQMIGPSQPIVAMVGDDTTLPCHLEPAVDATNLTLEWARRDLGSSVVHLRRNGRELLLDEDPSYRGRTSLSINKLKYGDISLKLSKVKLSDAGTYRCHAISTFDVESAVKLVVGSVSSPEIKISKVSNGVLLECKSAGWYPEPEVVWLDGEGNLLSAGPPETAQGPDGLHTVNSRVTVEKRPSSSFTCRVQQKNINQTRETYIHVPAELFMAQSSSAVRIIICLAVCFICIAALIFVEWKWRRSEIKTANRSRELQPLMTENDDRLKNLEKKRTELDEELQKNEGDLQHVQQVITTLMDQKKELKEQREKLTTLQQEDKTQIKENERKLTEKTKIGKEKKMEKRKQAKHDLKKRKTEHDELLKNTEKLLETTEELIIKMTERKGKLEKDQEQIKRQVKESEREREELQKKVQSEREEGRTDPSSNHSI